MTLRVLLFQTLLVCGLAGFSVTAHAQSGARRDPAAVETVCRTCHRERFESVAATPHAVLDTPAWREQTGNTPGCINCHGDVSAHIENRGQGNVITFRAEPPAEQSAVCMSCHSGSHPEFDSSAHAQSGMSCTSCHRQHTAAAPGTALLRESAFVAARLDDLGPATSLCTDCHQDVLTTFAFNERHRLLEGVLECTSCHDPHAPATRTLLGGFKQDQCLDCHTDKGGPFVFEHAASRFESCTACHSPHGSPNRHLLAHQDTGELCLTCHAAVPSFHLGTNLALPTRFNTDTQCTNCHSSIHGSNFSPFFLK